MSKRPVAIWRVIIGLLAVVALAACGGDDDSSSADNGSDSNGSGEATTETIEVVTTEFAFDPSSVSISAGSAEIVVDNTEGAVEHDFTVDELGIEVYAAAGETASDTYDVEAGTYTFYCSIPGHREAGMEGTLTVN